MNRRSVLKRSVLTLVVACVPAAGAPVAGDHRPQREPLQFLLRKTRFSYKADGKRLSDVLRDFAAAQGLPVVVDPKVEGLVSGSFDATPSEFLEALTRAYSLIWYFDGTALYVYPASAIQSRVFRLKGYAEQQVSGMLATLKLDSTRYPIRFDRVNSTLLVYGPPRHVELVSMAIESLDAGALEGTRRIVRVFRLQHASAGDRMLGSVRVTGVATTLSALYGGQRQRPVDLLANAQRDARRQMAPLNRAMQATDPDGRNRVLPDMKAVAPGGPAEAVAQARPLRSPLEGEPDDEAPVFEVDEASNAIIVLAKANRMAEISALIQNLDAPTTLVELEATFIEVATDNIDKLGIDWSLATNAVSVASHTPEQASVDRSGAGLLAAPFTVNTLLRDAGRSLLASVNALEGTGKARIISKPRVLGLANRPAVMVEKRVASVRVAGNLEANLYQVEAGTTLQITPQVTLGENGRPASIKLSIFIEDGNFEGNTVDKVPVLKRTEIRTEARVLEGESLLVGGISVESESGSNAGVPKLKSLPFVGGIFRSTMQRSARLERLFLLTPRLVRSMPPAELAAAPAPRTTENEALAMFRQQPGDDRLRASATRGAAAAAEPSAPASFLHARGDIDGSMSAEHRRFAQEGTGGPKEKTKEKRPRAKPQTNDRVRIP